MADATVNLSAPHSSRKRNVFSRLLDRIVAARIERGTINALSTLSNRELSDIGISRGDIDVIARAQAQDYLKGR